LLIILAIIDRILMAYKWDILLKAKNINVTLIDVIKVYYIGSFWGLLLPTGVGGDVLRAYLVGNKIKRKVDVFSSILAERLFGLVTSAVLALISVSLFLTIIEVELINVVFWLILALSGLAALLFFSFSQRIENWVKKENSRVGKNRFFEKLKRLFISYQSYKENKKELIIFSLWTLLEQMIPILIGYFTAIALKINIPFVYFVSIIPVVLIFARIPISVEGIGVQEGAYVYFFGLLGIASTEIFLISVIGHFLVLVALIPGAFMYFSGHVPEESALKTDKVVGEVQ